jgi:hypothetical protein
MLLVYSINRRHVSASRPSSGVIVYSPEAGALICQFLPTWCCQPCARHVLLLMCYCQCPFVRIAVLSLRPPWCLFTSTLLQYQRLRKFLYLTAREISCDCNLIVLSVNNSLASVRKRTIPTERPPLISEVSGDFLRMEDATWLAWQIPTAVFSAS